MKRKDYIVISVVLTITLMAPLCALFVINEEQQHRQEALAAMTSQTVYLEVSDKAVKAAEEYEAEQAALEEQYYYEETYYYAPSYDYPTEGLTREGGVNYYDGRRETYYSSNVAYHYRTSEWTLDEEGFWRTDEGYYVVAASDMEQGTTFEGSKGTCIVLDCGCADGTTDYYVGW